jgi:uncharacterized protein
LKKCRVLQKDVRLFVFLIKNKIPKIVKAKENLQSKSLKTYHQKYNPSLSLRCSMSDYREQDWMINLLLYAMSALRRVLEKQTGNSVL